MAHEPRLAAWNNVPDGSLFEVQVEPGDYTVVGDGRKTPTGPAHLRLGPAELVDRTFQIPIRRGDRFRLIIVLTYLSMEKTTGRIRARVRTPGGGTHQDDFQAEYQGSIGGDSPDDEVLFVVVGE